MNHYDEIDKTETAFREFMELVKRKRSRENDESVMALRYEIQNRLVGARARAGVVIQNAS
jgi:hypothetical protein